MPIKHTPERPKGYVVEDEDWNRDHIWTDGSVNQYVPPQRDEGTIYQNPSDQLLVLYIIVLVLADPTEFTNYALLNIGPTSSVAYEVWHYSNATIMQRVTIHAIVPPKWYYRLAGTGFVVLAWKEQLL